jgi:hypothetical protein
VRRYIKFVASVVAVCCVTAFAPLSVAAESKTSRKKSSTSLASSKKKSSVSSKKSAKSRKSRASAKSSKTRAKRERVPVVANDWIEQLPEVELPTESGEPEDELFDPVPEQDQP